MKAEISAEGISAVVLALCKILVLVLSIVVHHEVACGFKGQIDTTQV